MSQNSTQNTANKNQTNITTATDDLKANPEKDAKIENSVLETHKTGIEFNILFILLFLMTACRKRKYDKN